MTTAHLHNLLTREHELLAIISQKQDRIALWLKQYENTNELPLYSSVDIRDAGFKMAVVDTNLFPAGFNNLCEHGLMDAPLFFKLAVEKRVPFARDILIIAEEHTRNTWYLENVRILQKIIEDAGFTATVATFLTVQPLVCQKTNFVECETATGHPIRIHCLRKVLEQFETGERQIDLVILNNDLSSGVPEILKSSPAPIYPSIQAGWHARLKSHHFQHAHNLMTELAEILGIDPWFFSALYHAMDYIDIQNPDDRCRMQDAASDVLKQVQRKYQEHNILEKPYLVVKSDYGTYGMGVLPIEDPSDLAGLNRKNKNKLSSGKGARHNDSYIIQEGIPTIYKIDNEVSEICMYQIENHLIGGFFRSNLSKNARQNLNSRGMTFKKMCPHVDAHKECNFLGGEHNRPLAVFDIYRLLARIAAVATHREIRELEEIQK